MGELLGNPNTKRKRVVVVIGASLASLALTSCGFKLADSHDFDSSAQFRERASVAARYGFDYSAGYPERITEDGVVNSCLEVSPYKMSRVVVAQEGDDGVKVTPGSKKFETLHFIGLTDPDSPLQAADDYTAAVLQDYGCDTKPDGEIQPWD